MKKDLTIKTPCCKKNVIGTETSSVEITYDITGNAIDFYNQGDGDTNTDTLYCCDCGDEMYVEKKGQIAKYSKR